MINLPVTALYKIRVDFGGGGHELAAGCTLQEGPEKAEELLMDVVDSVLGDQL